MSESPQTRQSFPGCASYDELDSTRTELGTDFISFMRSYAIWEGDVEIFNTAWDAYLGGRDTPCPIHPAGLHTTYLEGHPRCAYCDESSDH